jgi:hypothetical protein
MSARGKLAAFAFVLLTVFAVGFGLGAVIDPGGAPAPVDHMNMNMR